MKIIQRATVIVIVCGLVAAPTSLCAEPRQEAGPAAPAGGTQSSAAGALSASKSGADNSQLVLRDGTPIRLSVDEPLSSKRAKVGDEVRFRVAAPVIVDNLVVIPRGAAVIGKVTKSRKPGFADRPGELAVGVDRVFLADSSPVPLRGQPQATRGAKTGLLEPSGFKGFDNLLVVPAFIAVTFLETGSHAAVPVGTLVSSYIQGDMVLDRQRVRQLQVPDTFAHVVVYFPPDRISRLLCAGCSKGKKAGDPESSPRVTKPVFVGSIEAARLTLDSYARLDLPPGRYWVHSTGKKDFQADLVAAQNYYLRTTQSGWGKANLEAVPPGEAEPEIAAATREMPVHIAADDPRLHDLQSRD